MNSDTLIASRGFKLFCGVVLSLFSAQGYAMSCRAGTTDAQDLCTGQDYSAEVATTQDRGAYIRYGSAYVDARTGSMGGRISLVDSALPGGPGLGNGQFGTSFDETFRITGPASSGPVIANMIFDVSGSISGNCVGCNGDITFLFRLDGANFTGFQSSVSGSRSLAQPQWTVNSSLFGLNSSAAIDPNNPVGTLSFDVSSRIGYEIRIRGDLGASVAFVAANPEGASITADASHTALFNIVLPAGYTLTPKTNANFLAAPVLQAVPVPTSVWLFGSGLLGLIGLNKRRRPNFKTTA